MKHIARIVLLGLTTWSFSACAAAADTPAPVIASVTATQASATPTIVWFPASETPTAQIFPTAGPTPERKAGVGSLLLTDDFSSAKPWNPAVAEDAAVSIGNGRLTIAAKPGINAFRVRQGPTLVDFYAEITARPSLCRDEDDYGLLFRAPNNVAFYSFSLSCNGTARAERVRLGKALPLHPPIPSADVPLGAPGEVRLGVWVSGSEMHFFLNDHYQFSASDPAYPSGSIGVFAHAAGNTPVTVTFSDLAIYEVNFVAPSATPLP